MTDSNPYRANESALESALPEGPVTPFVVSPSSPAEGLIAVVAAAHAEGGAVLFNEGKRMSPYTREWITNIRGRDTEFTIVGGLDRQPGLVDRMVDKARTLTRRE